MHDSKHDRALISHFSAYKIGEVLAVLPWHSKLIFSYTQGHISLLSKVSHTQFVIMIDNESILTVVASIHI
jgi:hypothetical protein